MHKVRIAVVGAELAVIRGHAEPLVTTRDGLRSRLVTAAIAEAARSGRIVGTLGGGASVTPGARAA